MDLGSVGTQDAIPSTIEGHIPVRCNRIRRLANFRQTFLLYSYSIPQESPHHYYTRLRELHIETHLSQSTAAGVDLNRHEERHVKFSRIIITKSFHHLKI